MFEAGVNLAASATIANDAFQFGFARLSDLHVHTVIGEHIQFEYVLVGLAGHQRVHATGVVADHSSQRAMCMRRWIRTKRQVVPLGRGAQFVENNARLYAGILLAMVQLENLVAVLGKIKDDGEVAALTAKTGAAASREHRRPMHPTEPHGRNCIFDISRNNDPNRNLAVVRSVGGVECTISIAEANLSFDDVTERLLQFARFAKRLVFRRMMRARRQS